MDMRVRIATELSNILKSNAPVRDGSKYPGARGGSPYPGNLRQNGTNPEYGGNLVSVEVGKTHAPYAPYTETRSHRKGWQAKSNEDFLQRLQAMGGTITNG